MFVKYSCGCVGFVAAGQTWVITACDHGYDDDYYGLSTRDMEDKTQTPLGDEEILAICKDLRELIRDGYNLRKVRWALGVQKS